MPQGFDPEKMRALGPDTTPRIPPKWNEDVIPQLLGDVPIEAIKGLLGIGPSDIAGPYGRTSNVAGHVAPLLLPLIAPLLRSAGATREIPAALESLSPTRIPIDRPDLVATTPEAEAAFNSMFRGKQTKSLDQLRHELIIDSQDMRR